MVTALVGAELEVLDGLATSVDENARDEHRLSRRIRALRAGRAEGRSWRDVLADEPHPGTLVLASRVLSTMTRVSGALRRTIAHGLQAQGETIAAIAERFGVTRQRISTLLRRGGSPESGA